MAILVTGGAGYIGSHTVVELQNAGYDVVVLDNLSNASEKSLDRVSKITGKPVKFYKADILDRDALNEIFDKENIFNNSFVNSITPGFLVNFKNVIIIFLITMVAKYLLDWYMSTKSGFLLRAVGDNDTIVTSLGVDKGLVKIVGLSIANGLVSLSGCIYAQQQRSFEISIGTGAVVIGLASVIIGTSLFKKVTFFRVTSSVVVGSILYKACVAVAMFAGISPNAIKLITAVLFLIILVISMDRKKVKAC